jgi:hypothetical protein
MDDHCGCILSYMYKYKIKLYVYSPFLFPLTPDYQRPRTKPWKVSDMTLNKNCKMSRPMLEREIVKQNPKGDYEENQIPAPSNICRWVVYDASMHPSIHPQFSSGLGSQVSSKCMHLVCFVLLG